MIARVWHGYTRPANAGKYEAMLKPDIIPGLRNLKGYRGSILLRKPGPDEVEFITVTLWDSMEAIRAVAGVNYEKAVVPEERRAVLTRYDPKATHYEVASVHGLVAGKG